MTTTDSYLQDFVLMVKIDASIWKVLLKMFARVSKVTLPQEVLFNLILDNALKLKVTIAQVGDKQGW